MADVRLSWDFDERELLSGLEKIEKRLDEVEKELGQVDKASKKAMNKSSKSTSKFQKSIERLKKPFQGFIKNINSVTGLIGVAFSVGAVVAFGRAAVRAF